MIHLLDNLLESPAVVRVLTDEPDWTSARPDGHSRWTTPHIAIKTERLERALWIGVDVTPGVALRRVRLRWRLRPDPAARYLGDALERAYGDLAWRGLAPERVMPWYVLAHQNGRTGGFGVACGGAALATWQVDAEGVTLDLDCRSGGIGVCPGTRTLELATVHIRAGGEKESAMSSARAFCRLLCPNPRLPREPVYGGNNWYYAYGRSSQRECLEDASRISGWADSDNRPWMVIDDGWQASRTWNYTGGPWLRGNEQFPDLMALAAGIRDRGAHPGLWYRPLLTDGMQPEHCFLKAPRPHGWVDHGRVLDPTVPEVREIIRSDMARLVGWGFELIKHDFSTYDLLGYWGSGLGGSWIRDGWAFHDRTRTSAEIVSDFYQLLRSAAGDALLLGCNTIGHLAAGTHELQRTGDDTSGRDWERTRSMGVNTLAMRMPQHDAFFAVDADCVGLTAEVPWPLNRQWLDVLARSGTPLFVSAAPDAMGPDQERAVRAAFACAAMPRPPSEPVDWMDTTCPVRWRHADGETVYSWMAPEGAPVPGELVTTVV
ncbi:MAG: hypothetical protein WCH98_05490 [Verrucomicrobiota bacterium]